jgi:hypothetical protein
MFVPARGRGIYVVRRRDGVRSSIRVAWGFSSHHPGHSSSILLIFRHWRDESLVWWLTFIGRGPERARWVRPRPTHASTTRFMECLSPGVVMGRGTWPLATRNRRGWHLGLPHDLSALRGYPLYWCPRKPGDVKSSDCTIACQRAWPALTLGDMLGTWGYTSPTGGDPYC